jgi:hypothetical protein
MNNQNIKYNMLLIFKNSDGFEISVKFNEITNQYNETKNKELL